MSTAVNPTNNYKRSKITLRKNLDVLNTGQPITVRHWPQNLCDCMIESMKEEVEEVLETLRPMLMQDGGNVELVDIDDGVVKLRLVGSCASCSSSTMTLKMGIEKALKKAIPMVRCIEAVE